MRRNKDLLLCLIISLNVANIIAPLPPLLWVSTRDEGLTEHLSQLNKIWQFVNSYCTRHIVIARFKSEYHYNDSGYIDLCDYFKFPSLISCGTETPIDLVHNNTYCSINNKPQPKRMGFKSC